MVKLQNAVLLENAIYESDGSRDQEISPLELSSSSGLRCNPCVEHLTPSVNWFYACKTYLFRIETPLLCLHSAIVRSPFFPPDVSSESATTSLRNTDDCRSGSEAIQRSDDVTVDSTVSGKRRIKFPMSMDNDQKVNSSTWLHLFIQKPRERISFTGKQIPQKSSFVASQSLSDDGEKRSKCRKHKETFEKELVMTSDQASVENQ